MTPDEAFYILMRTDLDSMNPGKAMAQASHAYPAMAGAAIDEGGDPLAIFHRWRKQTSQGFGRTIVLGGSVEEIGTALCRAAMHQQLISGWVVDPTYPVVDGDTTHLIKLATCAYVFGDRRRAEHVTTFMRLHP